MYLRPPASTLVYPVYTLCIPGVYLLPVCVCVHPVYTCIHPVAMRVAQEVCLMLRGTVTNFEGSKLGIISEILMIFMCKSMIFQKTKNSYFFRNDTSKFLTVSLSIRRIS